jgi:protein SCO1
VRPRYLLLFTAASAIAVVLIVVAANRARDRTADLREGSAAAAPALRFKGAELPAGVRAPDFRLRDQDGKFVTTRSLRGGPAVVTFLYTHCKDTCPITAQQVKGALDDLHSPVPAIAISVDPPNDTPASARAFLSKTGIGGRMRFLLGSRDRLRRVWKGFAVRPQHQHEEHQARLVLLDSRGMQRVGFPISQATPERIAHDLRALGAS